MRQIFLFIIALVIALVSTSVFVVNYYRSQSYRQYSTVTRGQDGYCTCVNDGGDPGLCADAASDPLGYSSKDLLGLQC